MLINWQAPEHVYLVCGKTDLRKGIDGLAMVVAENFGLDLYNNSLFLFCVVAMIGSKPFIGMMKVSFCYIKDMKMVV